MFYICCRTDVRKSKFLPALYAEFGKINFKASAFSASVRLNFLPFDNKSYKMSILFLHAPSGSFKSSGPFPVLLSNLLLTTSHSMFMPLRIPLMVPNILTTP